MSKAIMINIKPKYVADILNEIKKIEVRTTAPKDWKDYLSGKTKEIPKPINVYIYCTKDKEEKLFRNIKPFGIDYFDYCCISKRAKEYQMFTIDENEVELNGKVVAKFTLNKVEHFEREYSSRYIDDYYGDKGEPLNKKFYKNACLSEDELFDYIGSGEGYAWHINNLVIFDKPKELGEFDKNGKYCKYGKDIFSKETWCPYCSKPDCIGDELTKAPQSWCYVEELE